MTNPENTETEQTDTRPHRASTRHRPSSRRYEDTTTEDND